MITVGSRIKRERERHKLSQIDLSKKVGINNSVLSRIEADKRPVESDLLEKFAEIFDVSTDYLLGKTNNPIPYEKLRGIDLIFKNPDDDKNLQGLAFITGGAELTEDEIEHLKESLENYRKLKEKLLGNKNKPE